MAIWQFVIIDDTGKEVVRLNLNINNASVSVQPTVVDPPQQEEDDLTPKEAAAILKRSITTLYRLTRSGELPSYHLGQQKRGPIFIKRADLRKLKVSRRLNGVKF